jgi:hypothetical protein
MVLQELSQREPRRRRAAVTTVEKGKCLFMAGWITRQIAAQTFPAACSSPFFVEKLQKEKPRLGRRDGADDKNGTES